MGGRPAPPATGGDAGDDRPGPSRQVRGRGSNSAVGFDPPLPDELAGFMDREERIDGDPERLRSALGIAPDRFDVPTGWPWTLLAANVDTRTADFNFRLMDLLSSRSATIYFTARHQGLRALPPK